MTQENRYAFRKRLDEVHQPNRRNPDAESAADEIVIDSSWNICIGNNPPAEILSIARDLHDYFMVSMGVILSFTETIIQHGIAFSIKNKGKKRGYYVKISEKGISIAGNDLEGVRQGCFYLEDLMNLREAPFLKKGNISREPVFSPRMVHSGWGLDQYPDTHLNAIAHAGFDSILVFVKEAGRTTHGNMDFNDLIDRCEKYGLGVYFYSYLDSYKSPFDPDADDFFDRVFGSVFKASPKAKGLILVGESCCFPTTDERANPLPKSVNKDGISDPRPRSGWFPCRDYPEWLKAIKNAVRKYSPEADIVFWTYNWGRENEKLRVDLIKSLPKDVTLQATFEMFEVLEDKYPNHQTVTPDYSITFPGPGRYFSSEAKTAKEVGLKLYTMANTAGRTWDCGMIPYMPVPQQWFKRFRAMLDANQKWGLSGVMDCHHYGWFPSPVCEASKWAFWSPATDLDGMLMQIATRDFGKNAARDVVNAWQHWSDAVDSYTPGFDDQAGALRVGPAYPFIFSPILYPHAEQGMIFPTTPQATVKGAHLNAFYQPEHLYGMTNCGRRIHEDIKIVSKAIRIWKKGVNRMQSALGKVPDSKRDEAERQVGVGFFFYHTLKSMLHIKHWWLLNKQLEVEYNFKKANEILDKMTAIIQAEVENVVETMPLVKADSLLGWEPSIDYCCDPEHLEWKTRQLTNLLEHTLPAYRKTICHHPPSSSGSDSSAAAK